MAINSTKVTILLDAGITGSECFSRQVPLPWHKTQWDHMHAMCQQDRLPHALLLMGIPGLGKRLFAEAFASSLLCEQSNSKNQSCGQCQSCALLLAGHHPDLTVVQSEQAGMAIKVEQIRQIVGKVNQTSQYGRYKIIIIVSAESMNSAAANSLLKTLEEPSAHSVLILHTECVSRIPATVKSRCQLIKFTSPSHEEGLKWLGSHMPKDQNSALLLHLAAGAPLKALDLIAREELVLYNRLLNDFDQLAQASSDPVAIASAWHKEDLSIVLRGVFACVVEMIRFRFGHRTIWLGEGSDMQGTFQNLFEHVKCLKVLILFQYFDKLYEVQRLMDIQANVNTALMVDELFIGWHALFHQRH